MSIVVIQERKRLNSTKAFLVRGIGKRAVDIGVWNYDKNNFTAFETYWLLAAVARIASELKWKIVGVDVQSHGGIDIVNMSGKRINIHFNYEILCKREYFRYNDYYNPKKYLLNAQKEFNYLKIALITFCAEFAKKSTGPYNPTAMATISRLITESLKFREEGDEIDPILHRYWQWRDAFVSYSNLGRCVGWKDYDDLCSLTTAVKNNADGMFIKLIKNYVPDQRSIENLEIFVKNGAKK